MKHLKIVGYRYFQYFQYILFKISGLSPWKQEFSAFRKIATEDDSKNLAWNFSHAGSCYNILLFTVIIVMTLIEILKEELEVIETDTMFGAVSSKFMVISMLSASIIFIIYVVRQTILINVNNQFKVLDAELKNCADYRAEDDTNYSIFTLNFLMTIFTLAARGNVIQSVVRTLIWSTPFLISNWLIIQYTLLLFIIEKRFKRINRAVSKMGTVNSKISHSRESVLQDIGRIKLAYIILCDMCDQASNFYGFPTFISIFVLSIRSIFMLYYLILNLIRFEEMDTFIWLYASFLLRNVFLFTLLTTYVTKTIKENEKTIEVINELRDRYFMDEKIEQKLKKFSKNLLYMRVKFTVCDVLPLDRSLLAVISGTITTYLMIIIQFRLSSMSY
ncbi:GSCOCT00013877001.3-RA-CDS [Cotesia congregata]|uniref:Gustatory receptor n=1 Tax=Cotesia congregata TaxID=51543 RepID=A0A8J2E6K1_COTCN|nr:GSCOCT00013877001.3-RA-CDS [Cotesia congregata]CAG5075240.1 gustatory receptor 61 [Cotesia congregata]